MRAFVLLATLVLSPALGQEPIRTHCGAPVDHSFGWDVGAGGDVDGDGVGDYVVSGWRDHSVNSFGGVVRVYSGVDGSLLHEEPGREGETLGGRAFLLGDLDGDGFDDWGATPYFGTTSRLHSGLDGSVLYFDLPGRIVGVDDLNNDGKDDFLVTDFNQAIEVRSGADGSILYTVPKGFAHAVGDANNDGLPDFAVDGPSGTVTYYDGPTGAVITSWTWGAIDRIETAVAGDVDADGTADLMIQTHSPDNVRVHSGTDGALLYELPVKQGSFQHLGTAGDANLDGHDDFLAGQRLFSGVDGSLLLDLQLTQIGSVSAVGIGDVLGDGLPELLFGRGDSSPQCNSNDVGRVFRVSGHFGSSYCPSTMNSTGEAATIGAAGTTSIASNDLILVTDDVPPMSFGMLIYGDGMQTVPAGNGQICVAGGATGLFRVKPAGQSNAQGYLTIQVDYGALPANGQILSGSTWNFQAWFRDVNATPTQSNFSDALTLTFLP